MQVVEMGRGHEAAYEAFLASQRTASIYATLEFRSFLRRILKGRPRYLLAWQDDRVLAALPYFEAADDVVGTVINSLPWYGSHGGCLVGDAESARAREALLVHYREEIRRTACAFATTILLPNEMQYLDTYRAHLVPQALDYRTGQVTVLPTDTGNVGEALERAFRQKTRNLVRKARKQHFELIARDDDAAWEFVHRVHRENMERVGGAAKPWEHFLAIRDSFPTTWRQVLIASWRGEWIAGLIVLRFKETVEYLTPAVRPAYRSMQPLSFLIWHAMVDAVRAGFRRWNWGGTWPSQTSLHHFKAGWGARDTPYAYLVQARADAVRRLSQRRQEVSAAFPWYYLYPHGLLEG